MARRASKTAYFLNRTLKKLALIGGGVRFPETLGVWMMAADAVRAPWEVTELLAASYPEVVKNNLGFIALLTDFDVVEFERDLDDADRSLQENNTPEDGTVPRAPKAKKDA